MIAVFLYMSCYDVTVLHWCNENRMRGGSLRLF